MKYRIKNNTSFRCDLNNIILLANNNKKIALIKEYRMISGFGLKDSKDVIERCEDINGAYNNEKLLIEFKKHLICPEPITKKEFMNIIENALDNMDNLYFTDMLDAVEVLCDNIRKNGGLKKIAEKNSEFIESI